MILDFRKLTPEQETAINEELGDILHFSGDDIAVELGIPSREERDWTDEEIDIIWAYIEEWRPCLTMQALYPDHNPVDEAGLPIEAGKRP